MGSHNEGFNLLGDLLIENGHWNPRYGGYSCFSRVTRNCNLFSSPLAVYSSRKQKMKGEGEQVTVFFQMAGKRVFNSGKVTVSFFCGNRKITGRNKRCVKILDLIGVCFSRSIETCLDFPNSGGKFYWSWIYHPFAEREKGGMGSFGRVYYNSEKKEETDRINRFVLTEISWYHSVLDDYYWIAQGVALFLVILKHEGISLIIMKMDEWITSKWFNLEVF